MEGQDGELINTRKHSIRFRGAYQFTPEWLVSGNPLVQSGTPKECLGYYGPDADGDPTGYNNSGSGNYHWCGGKIVHPGDPGHTPWTKTVNLGRCALHAGLCRPQAGVQAGHLQRAEQQKATQTDPVGEAGDHKVNNRYDQGDLLPAAALHASVGVLRLLIGLGLSSAT